jgi:hypothetical protein
MAAKAVTDEVAGLVPFVPRDPSRFRTAERTYFVPGAIVLTTAIGSAIVNSQLHAHALGYLIASAGALWGIILFRLGIAQRDARLKSNSAARPWRSNSDCRTA